MIINKEISNNHYRPDIDGLRAIAVLSVLFFHLDIYVIRGGFVGVDIFFVISGFLITKLIKSEIDTTGTFNFANFYMRRIRRLLPALLVTLLVVTIFSALFLSVVQLKRVGGALISSLMSVSNFYFWLESDYFDISAKLKPLLHTWSLSIEEQFYLIWPTFLYFLFKLKKKWIPTVVLVIVGFVSIYLNTIFDGCFISLANKYIPQLVKYFSNTKSTIFFLMPFRIFEFTIGAIIVWLINFRLMNKAINEFILIFGLFLIGYSIVNFNDEILFPSYYALLPCLGTGLTIYAGKEAYLSKLLTNRFFVFIGLISYSLYLVHWPLIVFWTYLKGDDLLLTDKTLIIFFSIISGYLSYKYIEIPFRQKYFYFNKIKWKVIATTSALTVALTGIHMNSNAGWFWRIDFNQLNSLGIENNEIDNYSEFHRKYYGGAGYPKYGAVNTNKPADILLIGDSHARQYAEGVYQVWAKPNNLSLHMAAGISCFHLPNFTRITKDENWDLKGGSGLFYALNVINTSRRSGKKPLIIMSHDWVTQMKRADLLDKNRVRMNVKVRFENIASGILEFKKLIGDCQLIVIGNVPTTNGKNILDIVTRPKLPYLSDFLKLNYHESEAVAEIIDFNNLLQQVADNTGEFIFLDPHDVLCDKGKCRNLNKNSKIIYSDETHLSKFGSLELIRGFTKTLRNQ